MRDKPTDQPPDRFTQQALILRVQQNALDAQEMLPDFICTQLTTRSEDKTGNGRKWKKRDSMEVEFSFVDRKPNWKLVKFNGKDTHRTYGSVNQGFGADLMLQFFSLPGSVFGEKSGAVFEWDRWDRISGKRVAVFSVRQPASTSMLELRTPYSRWILGFHGSMYVEPEAADILRIEVALDPPRGIGMNASDVTVDYGSVTIGGGDFLLPVRAVARANLGVLSKSEIEVVKYQKYGADSTIKFGDQ